MFPQWRKLELFARRHRPGWTCLGNESPMTNGEDIRESIGNLLDSFDGTTQEKTAI
jgi:N6-adenosine-specific RNA methylase IME4